jgi:hypothetical protein
MAAGGQIPMATNIGGRRVRSPQSWKRLGVSDVPVLEDLHRQITL